MLCSLSSVVFQLSYDTFRLQLFRFAFARQQIIARLLFSYKTEETFGTT